MPEMPNVIPGEDVESDWGNLIRSRTVQRYASAVVRTSQNPSPQDGDMSYLDDDNTVSVFDGSSWVILNNGFTGFNRGKDPGSLHLDEGADWTDFGTPLDLGSVAVGLSVTVAAVAAFSSLNDSGQTPTYRSRIRISLDGGATWGHGSQAWGTVSSTLRRQTTSAVATRSGIPSAAVQVQLQGLSAVGSFTFGDGWLSASMMPTSGFS